MKLLKTALLASALLASTSAYAQTVNTDTIVVTARKHEEKIQDVPVSVIVNTGENLENASIKNVNELFGFNTRPSGVGGNTMLFSIRGQSQNDVAVTMEPSVGVYVDGVYQAQAYSQNSSLLDVKNVQVLMGPQGTLFGRNTTGGAVLINTNDPVLGEATGEASLTYGRFNNVETTGIANIPVNDKIAIRVAGNYITRDGYVTDRATGAKYSNIDSNQQRIKILFQPSDDYRMVITGNRFEDHSTVARRMIYGTGSFASLATTGPADDVTELNGPPVSDSKIYSITVDNTIGDNLKFIANWRRVNTFYGNSDFDGSPMRISDHTIDVGVDHYSAEVQYRNTAFNDRLDYTVGGIFFGQEGYEDRIGRGYLELASSRYKSEIRNRSYSAFGHASYDLTDRLTVDAGVRYTHDTKRVVGFNKKINLLPEYTERSCQVASLSLVNDCRKQTDLSYDNVSWSAGLNYKITPNTLVYGKVSTGYKAGGGQFFESTDVPALSTFQPENITEFEAGVKGTLFNDRVNYAVAGYYNELRDMQVMVVYNGTIVTTRNAAKARNYGFEAQVAARVTDNLTVRGFALFEDPKYLEWTDPGTGADKRDSQFYLVAKKQFAADATYKIDRYTFNASYTWVDRTPGTTTSLSSYVRSYGATEGAKMFKLSNTEAHGLLNLRANAQFGNLDVSVWGKNVLNTRYNAAVNWSPPFMSAVYNEPATYGVTARVKF